jgi:alpha-tubulin suppressor-like RCC1 family protein
VAGLRVRTVILLLPLAACSADRITKGVEPKPDTVDIFVADGVNAPARVGGPALYLTVTAGELHTCAITTTGAAQCWGAHALGVSWTQRTPWPVSIADGRTYASISAGTAHTCGGTASGSVYCWGRENPFGAAQAASSWQLPQRLQTDEPVTGIISGVSFGCGLRLGAAVCWGHNIWGQLGSGDAAPTASISEVAGGLEFAHLGTAMGQTVCGITTDARLYCWGRGDTGQLADAPTGMCNQGACATEPRPIIPQQRFRAVAAGPHHTCAITTDGQAFCWGLNGESNRLGSNAFARDDDSRSNAPIAVTTDARFTTVTVGADHACALSVDGTAWCWGSNRNGQLGALLDAPWWYPSQPTVGNVPMPFHSISAGAHYTCGVSAMAGVDGRIYCWGRRGEHLGVGITS